jgi:quercetin dioxygenase-like cupin family protein
MEREAERSQATMRLVAEQDVLWTLEGAERVLVGLSLSTERVTVGRIRLRPGPRSDVHRHAGDECVFLLGEAGDRACVRLPENDGQRWFELEPEDALYLPAGTPHRYQNVSGRTATLFFIVAPSYDPPTA